MGSSSAKFRWFGQAAWAAARSAPFQSRADSGSSAKSRRASLRCAVALVVGQVAGQVAERGVGPAGHGAPAVAVGAERGVRGDEGLVEPVDLGLS